MTKRHTEAEMRQAFTELCHSIDLLDTNDRTTSACIIADAIAELMELRPFWECARQENIQFRTVIGRLHDWVHTFGAALCPGRHADTFGEGIHEAKRQVAEILNNEETK
jgi:hypothetical protein